MKGVPLFYLPIIYYPIKKDDRATGFLIPQYGTSTLRGQTLSNAFFWAINRSSDATVIHDWFSRAGQGVRRRVPLHRRAGVRGQRPDLHPQAEGDDLHRRRRDGYAARAARATRSARRCDPEAAGGPARARQRRLLLRRHGPADLLHEPVRRLAPPARLRRQRGRHLGRLEPSAAPTTAASCSTATTDSAVYGLRARASRFGRAARKIGGSPVYFSLRHRLLDRCCASYSAGGVTAQDQGLNKFEFSPQVRVPFTKWPFLQLNGVVALPQHLVLGEPGRRRRARSRSPLFRRYLDLRGEVVGPTFTRVWDTPDNGYAEKFKHVIEPNFTRPARHRDRQLRPDRRSSTRPTTPSAARRASATG